MPTSSFHGHPCSSLLSLHSPSLTASVMVRVVTEKGGGGWWLGANEGGGWNGGRGSWMEVWR